jgi:hypothetical protein
MRYRRGDDVSYWSNLTLFVPQSDRCFAEFTKRYGFTDGVARAILGLAYMQGFKTIDSVAVGYLIQLYTRFPHILLARMRSCLIKYGKNERLYAENTKELCIEFLNIYGKRDGAEQDENMAQSCRNVAKKFNKK